MSEGTYRITKPLGRRVREAVGLGPRDVQLPLEGDARLQKTLENLRGIGDRARDLATREGERVKALKRKRQ